MFCQFCDILFLKPPAPVYNFWLYDLFHIVTSWLYAKWLAIALRNAGFALFIVYTKKPDICVLTLCSNGGGDTYIASKFASLNETCRANCGK